MGLFRRKAVLRTDPHGFFQGPLAHALATGAHLPTASGGVWNAVPASCACCDAREERDKLRDSWGITDAAGWDRALRALVEGPHRGSAVATVLELRGQAASRTPGQPFDAGTWPDLIAAWCWERGAGPGLYEQLVTSAAQVWEYEERMVRDGVLPRGVPVRTVRAYDFGRAVNLARWGVNAGYADERAAHAHILRAGAASMHHHGSWEEMSAGFVLGRAMAFDEGAFGSYYTDSAAAHRVLVSDPHSPWRNLPWRM
ncbi:MULTISPECIES: DUF1266 domain-containing protein [unclassified Nocardiopsis]|uniref:DUF1266 domain-containing protein n=1 Tax=unclassified Nocardiopsis TaxID=2649073 RepID=UPI0013567F96|nr:MULTISPECIES: DUF1266 domain-containing protein [unclassified Nocardiopsis]